MHRQIAGRLTGRVTKWLVLVFWLLVAGVCAPLAGQLTDVQNNEAASWLPDSAESTRAFERLEAFQDPNAILTTVVYERRGGLTLADLAALGEDARALATLDGVEGEVIGPIPSQDGEAAQTVVTFNFGSNGWSALPNAAEEIRDLTERDGVSVHVTGPGGQAADSAEVFESIDGTLLVATAVVVIVILLITYRSPALWLLPVVSAMISLVVAQGVVYLLATYADLTVNGQSQSILTILVFGAGTDYALLLVARYREELRRHDDRHEAMAFALHRAAPAVIASACTTTLGLLALSLASMNSTAGLGPVAAVGIVVALAVMVTLLPALLVITGRWIFWPKRPAFGSDEPTATGSWARLGQRIARSPRPVWAVTTVLLAIACLGIFRLDANGLTAEEQYLNETDSVAGARVLTEHGLLDESSPVQVVANAAQAEAVAGSMSGLEGLGPIAPPVVLGDTALISAPVLSDPTSPAAFDTVERVRAAVGDVEGADALVGGGSALYLDILNASARDNLVVIPAVLAVVLLVLVLLLRSLLAPVLLIATVVLSFGAALGLSALLFEGLARVYDQPGFTSADASLPLFVFVFLVALGIDYNIFLMTRVREETFTHGTRQATLIGLAATGGVITSAGAVLAATFLVLGTLPLVPLVQIGVAVALGVLLDTFVVRSVLVSALNLDLGSRIWWPSKLDRDTPPEGPGPESEPERAQVSAPA